MKPKLEETGVFDVQSATCPHCNHTDACENFTCIERIKDTLKDINVCPNCNKKFIIDYDNY